MKQSQRFSSRYQSNSSIATDLATHQHQTTGQQFIESPHPLPINSLNIKRFKSIQEIDLQLDRVTVLVGANNAGKSSILQAVQFGVSAAQSLSLVHGTSKTSGTLAVDELVYAPLREVQTLAYGGNLRQAEDKQIEISFNTSGGDATVTVRKGKNTNLNVSADGEEDVLTQLRNITSPFSAYSPGLAGIPPIEEFRSPGVVRRAAAYGDANSVFRNVLLILRNDRHGWQLFSERMNRVFPDIGLDIRFDPENDSSITANVIRAGNKLPIDAAGTGVLQTAQILSYIGLYKPKLLILDEPDSHLHPSNQRVLLQLLSELAEEADFQVLFSTHSRHLLDESYGTGAAVRWISDGKVNNDEASRLPVLMSLGALDIGDRLKGGSVSTIVLTEDANTKYLRALLKSSGIDMGASEIWPYNGCTNLAAAKILASFIKDIAPDCNIIVHRDRDYLSDGEIDEIVDRYKQNGFALFFTDGTDIESHFLNIAHLKTIYCNRDIEEIGALLDEATSKSAEDSIRLLTNARHEQATLEWVPANGRRPAAGDCAVLARDEYNNDPIRYRHGKKTLHQFNKLAEERWGASLNIVAASDALAINILQPDHLSTDDR